MRSNLTPPQLLLLFLLSSACHEVQGQEEEPATPLPYLTTSQLNERLRQLVNEDRRSQPAGSPERARVVVVGVGILGEEILAVEIGAARVVAPVADDALGAIRRNHGAKSALLLVAGIEGDRLVGTSVATHLVESLLALDVDAFEELFAEHQLYVIPRLNPSGARRYFDGLSSTSRSGGNPKYEHAGNARVLDRDRDGRRNTDAEDDLQLAEDGPLDLDGDGLILKMRVEDDEGTLMQDPDEPREMRAADAEKGEDGVYVVHDEGRDQDGDGDYAENGSFGINPNRNFGHAFAEHELSSGLHAASEPETRALLDYVLERRNIEMVLVYGAHDNLGNVPKAEKPPRQEGGADGEGGGRGGPPEQFRRRRSRSPRTKLDKDDREVYVEVAKLRDEHNEVKGRDAADAEGAFHQWGYFHFGVPAFAVNLFEASLEKKKDDEKAGERKPRKPKKPPEEEEEAAGEHDPEGSGDNDAEDDEETPDPVQVAIDEVRKTGFVDWHEHEHDTLGTVEIGGWRPYVRGNPPETVVAVIAEREVAFVRDLLGRFSNLEIEDVNVEELSRGLYEVKARVRNSGLLPSSTRQGSQNRETGPVIVVLDTEKENLIHGSRRTMIDRLEAQAGERLLRWVVRADAGTRLDLVVSPPKSHFKRVEVVLP